MAHHEDGLTVDRLLEVQSLVAIFQVVDPRVELVQLARVATEKIADFTVELRVNLLVIVVSAEHGVGHVRECAQARRGNV